MDCRLGVAGTTTAAVREPLCSTPTGRGPEPPVPACSAHIRRSAERKPDEFLYLLVRAGGAWQFPQAEHRAGETARQARARLVRGQQLVGIQKALLVHQRSADAAKEIRGLIEHSVQDTEAGSKRVDTAKETIGDIVEIVSKVSNIMQDITQASEEQNMGIQQVAVAINQMDVVTQQNAALVEESAAITVMMDERTGELESMVSVFHTETERHEA